MPCPLFSPRRPEPARAPSRRTVARVALAVGLAGSATLGACATPGEGGSPAGTAAATQRPVQVAQSGGPMRRAVRVQQTESGDFEVARYGIGVLAPALPLPVRPVSALEAHELPPDPCLDDDDVGLLCAAAMVEPDWAAPDPQPQYALELQPSDLGPGSKMQVVYGIAKPRKRWFASVGSQTGMVYGDRNWTYREADGPTVAVGNLNTNALSWGSPSLAIGGLQLSSPPPADGKLEPGEFGYTSSIGRLNNTDLSATSGAVVYGASVGSSSFSYGLMPDVTLQGQLQSAPSLTAGGVGTTYRAGPYGSVQAGVMQSTYDAVAARRYRIGYDVNVIDELRVGVITERTQSGFSDLSTYESGAASPYSRNIWTAGLPISGLGTLSGTYTLGSGLDPSDDERRVGLVQSIQLAPQVQFAVGADRDIVTGDYDVRANISMPVDAFMRGRWLGY
ncbi:hypothetical protein [Bordetella genomosp. 13]|uniref:Fimbrial protein n=1 Tax=Bordetella genomosp. 13 TaxID=463040 RepID=A0A1W6ZG49_9BORD|nr:hypothetical protein [Bordetella genomosp. 13]ARP96287.1 hypothetical protein CAL15_19060 [Bordetella genomosp. 13]